MKETVTLYGIVSEEEVYGLKISWEEIENVVYEGLDLGPFLPVLK